MDTKTLSTAIQERIDMIKDVKSGIAGLYAVETKKELVKYLSKFDVDHVTIFPPAFNALTAEERVEIVKFKELGERETLLANLLFAVSWAIEKRAGRCSILELRDRLVGKESTTKQALRSTESALRSAYRVASYDTAKTGGVCETTQQALSALRNKRIFLQDRLTREEKIAKEKAASTKASLATRLEEKDQELQRVLAELAELKKAK